MAASTTDFEVEILAFPSTERGLCAAPAYRLRQNYLAGMTDPQAHTVALANLQACRRADAQQQDGELRRDHDPVGARNGFSRRLQDRLPRLHGGPTPQRERLAGPVFNIERLVADGNTVTAARQLTTKRSLIDVHKAQLVSSPYQSTLAADFYALDAA
jgi:hypothetical protein